MTLLYFLCRQETPLSEISLDRKSTRLNSSHSQISYAVFCLKKKNKLHKALTTHYVRSSTTTQIFLTSHIYPTRSPHTACHLFASVYIMPPHSSSTPYVAYC